VADKNVVSWNNSYSVGVPLIDEQHKGLIEATNELFVNCLRGGEAAEMYFMKTIQGAVKYVKTHFTTEEVIMERLKYPEFAVHKKEHEDFVAEVLKQVNAFVEAKTFTPLDFAQYLRTWVLTHIAKSDKRYAAYFDSLRAQGTLDESAFAVSV
jgi:hemerythrin